MYVSASMGGVVDTVYDWSRIPECLRACVPNWCVVAPACNGRLPGDEFEVGGHVYRCVPIDYASCDEKAKQCIGEGCKAEIVYGEGEMSAVYMGRATTGRPKPPQPPQTQPPQKQTESEFPLTTIVIVTAIILIVWLVLRFIGGRRFEISPLVGEVKGRVKVS